MQLFQDLSAGGKSLARKSLHEGCCVCGVEPLASEVADTAWGFLGDDPVYVCTHCDKYPDETQKVLDDMFKRHTDKLTTSK